MFEVGKTRASYTVVRVMFRPEQTSIAKSLTDARYVSLQTPNPRPLNTKLGCTNARCISNSYPPLNAGV